MTKRIIKQSILIIFLLSSILTISSCNKNKDDEKKVIHINYELNGGVLPSDSTTWFYDGVGLDVLPTPVKDGYSFLGWYINDVKQENIASSINTDVYLTASWEKIIIKHQINYSLDGGTMNINNSPKEFIEGVGLNDLPTPVKDGYSFLGWYINETKQESITSNITHDVTLTAKWEKNEIPLNVSLTKEFVNVGKSIYLNIENTYDYSLYNISTDNDNISIDEFLEITGNQIGTTKITITLISDPTITKSLIVEVIEKAPVINSISNKLAINEISHYFIKNSDELTYPLYTDYVWTINDSDKVSLNSENHYLTGLQVGTVTLTASLKSDPRVSSSYNIEIVDPNTSVVLNTENDKYEYWPGEMFSVNICGSTYNKADFTWKSSDTSIIRILENGDVIAVNTGITSINVYETKKPTNRTSYKIIVLDNQGVNHTDYIGNLLSIAYSQIGYHEEKGNYSKYGEWYGLNPGAWCAMFVSWCWYQAGLSNDLMVKYCSCSAGQEWAIENNIFHYKNDYTPKSGDLIFFTSSGMSHTGICAYVEDGYMYTIEGNSSDKVGIWRWSLNDARITGYANPDYPSLDTPSKDFSFITGKDENGNYYWTNVAEKQPVL